MVLAVTRACPEVWMHESSVRGGAVSALAQAAAASFYGAALAAAPAMLPLLSVVPAGVRTAETFESLLLGLFGGAGGSRFRHHKA